MSEKKTKKPVKKAPAKKTPAKKAPKKAPVKKAVKKSSAKRAPKKGPEVVQAPGTQPEGQDPASMRTLLTEALMMPTERKQFHGGSGRGFGNPRPPAVSKPVLDGNGSFVRHMDADQMLRVVHELHAAMAQARLTVARAEGLMVSLSKEIERVGDMKKELFRGEFKKEELQAKADTASADNSDKSF